MTHAWVLDLLARNLLESAQRNTALFRHSGPATLSVLKAVQDEFVYGFHLKESTPINGCSQPSIGQKTTVAWKAMGKARGSKVVSHPARVTRQAIAEKVTELVKRAYPGIAPSTAFEKIKDATGISLSSLQRITKGELGPSSDTLANLAYHLGSTVGEIVTPKEGEGLGGSKPSRKPLHPPHPPPTQHPPK